MNLFGKRLGRGGKTPGEAKETKSQRLSGAFFSPSYLLSVGVLLCAAMPAFKVPVDSFDDGAMGTLATYIQHLKAPDWRRRFAFPHWAKTMRVQTWSAAVLPITLPCFGIRAGGGRVDISSRP